MPLVFAASASRHGLEALDTAFAMAHAQVFEPEHRTSSSRGIGPVDLYIGPTPGGVVIEVLAERRDGGVVLVFHAMPINARRVKQIEEARRRRWGR